MSDRHRSKEFEWTWLASYSTVSGIFATDISGLAIWLRS
jgi:hypothetical protein